MKAHITKEPADICKINRNDGNVSIMMPPKDSHRNALCSCGSGKKYKRCCYGKNLYEPLIDRKLKKRGVKNGS